MTDREELNAYLNAFKIGDIIVLTDELRNLLNRISKDLLAIETLKDKAYINCLGNLAFYDSKLSDREYKRLIEVLDYKPRNYKVKRGIIKDE